MDLYNFAGHGRTDLRDAMMMPVGILPAAQPLWINNRHLVTASANGDIKSPFRRGLLANAILVYVRIQEKQVTVRLCLTNVESVNTIANLRRDSSFSKLEEQIFLAIANTNFESHCFLHFEEVTCDCNPAFLPASFQRLF